MSRQNDDAYWVYRDALLPVAYCVVRMDLWICKIVEQALGNDDTRFFGEDDLRLMVAWRHIHSTHSKSWKPTYNGHVSQDEQIRKEMRRERGVEDYVVALEEKTPILYLKTVIDQGIDTYRDTRRRYERTEERGADGLLLPSEFTDSHGSDITKFLKWSRSRYYDAHRALMQVHRVALELRSSLPELISLSDAYYDDSDDYIQPPWFVQPPKWITENVKPRMAALNENFPKLCRELGKPVQHLLGDDPKWWIVDPPTKDSSQAGTSSASQSSKPNQIHMPSDNTARDINGPQLMSSVFNAPVYFGDAHAESSRAQTNINERQGTPETRTRKISSTQVPPDASEGTSGDNEQPREQVPIVSLGPEAKNINRSEARNTNGPEAKNTYRPEAKIIDRPKAKNMNRPETSQAGESSVEQQVTLATTQTKALSIAQAPHSDHMTKGGERNAVDQQSGDQRTVSLPQTGAKRMTHAQSSRAEVDAVKQQEAPDGARALHTDSQGERVEVAKQDDEELKRLQGLGLFMTEKVSEVTDGQSRTNMHMQSLHDVRSCREIRARFQQPEKLLAFPEPIVGYHVGSDASLVFQVDKQRTSPFFKIPLRTICEVWLVRGGFRKAPIVRLKVSRNHPVNWFALNVASETSKVASQTYELRVGNIGEVEDLIRGLCVQNPFLGLGGNIYLLGGSFVKDLGGKYGFVRDKEDVYRRNNRYIPL